MSRRQLICLVFALVGALYFSSAPAADNDLWGHVLFGRQILESGALPSSNGYAYTAPDHPWINHEILAECVFAWLYDHLGSAGLLFFKIAVGMLTILIMKQTAERRGAEPLGWGLALGLSASIMSWGFLIRPQLFTFLAVALLWDRLHADAAGRGASCLATLPLLFVVWINTHGGSIAGLAIFAAYLVLEGVRRDSRERRWLVLSFLLCAAALFANPYGYRLPAFLAHDLTRVRQISEWSPIPLFDGSHLRFKLAVTLCLVGAITNRGRPFWESGIIALGAIAAFRHERHAPLFAILAAPLLARTVSDLLQALHASLDRSGRQPAFVMLLGAMLAIAAWQLWQVGAVYRGLYCQIFVSPRVFPVDAVRFISRNHLRGNLLLPFDWGEYAIWHLYPRCRVSVDGRYTTAYPDAVLDQSNRLLVAGPGWERSLHDASIALIDRRQPIARLMFDRPDWQYVYSDATALVFVRKDLAGPPTWERRTRDGSENAFFFP